MTQREYQRQKETVQGWKRNGITHIEVPLPHRPAPNRQTVFAYGPVLGQVGPSLRGWVSRRPSCIAALVAAARDAGIVVKVDGEVRS